jgi:hypothetical protein
MWSASDFSWAGLADAGWELGENASPAQKLKRWRAPPDFPKNAEGEGKRPTSATAKASRWKKATLQDYWRWSFGVADGPIRLLTDGELKDLGLLVADEQGVLWHLLHSPQTASNSALLTAIGIPVDDQSVAELDAAFGRPLQDKSALVPIIQARLKSASAPEFKRSPLFTTEFASFDPRVQLVGARVDRLKDWGDPAVTTAHINASMMHARSAIQQNLSFGDATSFEYALFEEAAAFDGVQFGEGTRFQGAAFLGVANFKDAKFKHSPSFSSAKFAGGMQRGLHWISVDFDGAEFGFGADLTNATFGPKAAFSGATFHPRCSFAGSRFQSGATFAKAKFGEETSFLAASLGPDANFAEAQFFGIASFEKATFGDNTGFQKAKFEMLTLRGAQFAGEANFRETRIRSNGVIEARFATMPDFAGARLHSSVSFDRAQYEYLGRRGFALSIRYLVGAACLMAIFLAANWFGASGSLYIWILFGALVALGCALCVGWGANEQRVHTEATRARTLVTIFEGNKNHIDQARAFRHALKAQRLRLISPPASAQELPRFLAQLATRPWEKGVGLLYELTSDYGLSLLRPLLVAGALIAASAYLYWQWEGTRSDEYRSEAVAFSLSRTLPLGPWGEVVSDDDSCSFRERLLAGGSEKVGDVAAPCRPASLRSASTAEVSRHRLSVQAAATAQSTISAVLLFLFGLAVRRRFQIN